MTYKQIKKFNEEQKRKLDRALLKDREYGQDKVTPVYDGDFKLANLKVCGEED